MLLPDSVQESLKNLGKSSSDKDNTYLHEKTSETTVHSIIIYINEIQYIAHESYVLMDE